ncbi:MAG: prolyl oligopeptidase family serine peptidase [Gemmatimonadaceae bacterium]|nr:prolyl oligopeptidase family serine peptidase [Gemmatimonadaceae bacterium]
MSQHTQESLSRHRRMACRWVGTVLLGAGLTAAHGQAAPPRGTVHTDSLWSQSLGATKALTVYLPPSYRVSSARRYPVLVYLHGLTGDERNWVDAGRLDRTLDSLFAAGQPEAIVVMPDGDDGWYTTWNGLADLPGCRADRVRKEPADAYCVPWQHYDDYIARDIVAHVDGRYRTYADGRHRGIAGLSMGGYGAVALALAYPDVFAAAASHSGVLSPRYLGPTPFASPPQYAGTTAELERSSRGLWRYMAPAFGRDTIGWAARDPAELARRAMAARRMGASRAPALPRLLIDCGVNDQYINQNRDFHQTLLRLGVSHQYAEWPGAHTWGYWTAHAPQSVSFLLATVGAP